MEICVHELAFFFIVKSFELHVQSGLFRDVRSGTPAKSCPTT